MSCTQSTTCTVAVREARQANWWQPTCGTRVYVLCQSFGRNDAGNTDAVLKGEGGGAVPTVSSQSVVSEAAAVRLVAEVRGELAFGTCQKIRKLEVLSLVGP